MRVPVQGLLLGLQVQIERGEGHVVPHSGVVLESLRRFLEAPEGLFIPCNLIQGETVVVQDLWSLLRGQSRDALIWVFLVHVWLVRRVAGLTLIQEFESLAEVEDGQIILLKLQVHHAQVVKVILWVI